MFGRKHRVHHAPVTPATSHRTHPRTSGGLMNRLRSRHHTSPMYTSSTHTSTVPVTSTHRAHRSHGLGSSLGLGRKRRTAHHSTTTGGVMPHHSHRRHHVSTTTTSTTHAVPARRTSIGDKVSGAMLKLRGSVTGRPGVKAAGSRRMHGTDGRGARRYY